MWTAATPHCHASIQSLLPQLWMSYVYMWTSAMDEPCSLQVFVFRMEVKKGRGGGMKLDVCLARENKKERERERERRRQREREREKESLKNGSTRFFLSTQRLGFYYTWLALRMYTRTHTRTHPHTLTHTHTLSHTNKWLFSDTDVWYFSKTTNPYWMQRTAHTHTDKHTHTHKRTLTHTQSLSLSLTLAHIWLVVFTRGCIVYKVAMISRLLQIIGLFCKRALWKRRYSAKQIHNFKEPTKRSHPIPEIINGIRKDNLQIRSLLQNIVSFIGLFCKRDLWLEGAYWA